MSSYIKYYKKCNKLDISCKDRYIRYDRFFDPFIILNKDLEYIKSYEDIDIDIDIFSEDIFDPLRNKYLGFRELKRYLQGVRFIEFDIIDVPFWEIFSCFYNVFSCNMDVDINTLGNDKITKNYDRVSFYDIIVDLYKMGLINYTIYKENYYLKGEYSYSLEYINIKGKNKEKSREIKNRIIIEDAG